MVLGRKTNPRSATSIQVDYLITIQEIKPWPPSPLLASLRSVIIQWENGESSSGCTRSVVPVPQSNSIEFNETFQLPLTLQKDMSSSKPPENAAFLKNNLILNLYEPPRRDNNITKGKLIATAMIDLADYGVVEEALRIRAAMNCKRSFRNMVQPVLYVDILPSDKARTCSSSCGSLSKELSLVEVDGESIAASMISHEYAEEAFSSSASRKYRGGGFPSRNKQVKLTDEIFQQNPTRVDAGGGRNGENGYEEHYLMEEAHSTENGAIEISAEAMQHPGTGTFSFSWGNLAMKDDVLTDNIQEHVDSSKSSSSDTAIRIGLHNHVEEKEHERDEDSGGPDDEQVVRQRETRGDTKRHITDRRRAMSDAKVQHLQRRIQMLEGELTEAAAMEVALYSVVAEHGNSASKTHAPARRLCRLYLHALSQSQQASAARSALSGLVLVVKACGNDVPRLTFWLSNSIMLRAILSQAIVKKKLSQQSFLRKKSDRNVRVGDQEKDEELENFIADVEKIEAWIFSRTVESIWWQILTPHMQSTAARRINRDKRHGSDSRRLALAHAEEQAQADISLGIWKAAFKDACERLCPVRARGQKCGCLSLPGQLIMEQCVARLDVAMFNALLRESDDDIPTDPVSDPISDPKVLPISAGKKLSFRAGAQLKNVIGNWSRWLTDLLGMYNIESDEDDPKSETKDTPFRSFRLLYALSDLMMLPKDLLLNRTTRKEVCPTFGALLILRVLENFIPDEFCPDPVPEEVLEALIHEDPCECGAEELLNMYPCTAAPPIYSPPSAASISAKSQQKSDGSLMKSQNSDDELDQVSSPLASISLHPSSSSPDSTLASSLWKETVNRNVCRYQLLRDIWMNE